MKQLTDHIVFRHGAETTNRIVQTPMLTNSGVNEMVTDATLDYYSQRSHSAGIVIVEYTNASINDRVSCQDSGDLFSFPYGCRYIYPAGNRQLRVISVSVHYDHSAGRYEPWKRRKYSIS